MPDETRKKNPSPETSDKEPFDRVAYLKEVRAGLLKNLGLPEGTRPENVAQLLELKEALAKIKKSGGLH